MSLLGSLMGKVRCPKCGAYERHPRDTQKEREIAEGNRMSKRVGLGSGDQSERAFVCTRCSYRFDLDSALRWAPLARQTSEQFAIREYAKARKEAEEMGRRAGSVDLEE